MRIEAAGVCHSDLSVVDGNRVRPVPMLLGHEASGRVEALGPGVTDLAVGQRVVMTFLPRCGECAGCATGGRMPCGPGSVSNTAGELLGGGRRLSRNGIPVHHHLGVSAFATHAVVDTRSVVAVDDDVPPAVAAVLGCAVLTGGGALLNAAPPETGQSVLVVGLGGVGMAALLTAVALGAGEVVAVDALAAKREQALELGAARALSPDELASSGATADVVVEAAGNVRAFEAALAATAPGGRIVTVGTPPPRRPGQHLAARPGGPGEDGDRELPRLGGAGARHPGVRAVVARGPAARRGAGLGRASASTTSTTRWTSSPPGGRSGRSSSSDRQRPLLPR